MISFYIQETSYTQNGKQILHSGEYQWKQTMKMKNIHYISYFTQISTYQIIKDPCNGKQCQHNISSYEETTDYTKHHT